ncbi:MAG TPA: hypothetical protein VJN88_14185 [Ktedonobacterales bacterium]|nr:hypothetical protein [Ktedonobacterales bacterium]
MTYSTESDNRRLPASSLERRFLTDGRHTADDFPDPFADHDIEYWVWDGERLIPASTFEIQGFEEQERARAARRRLSAFDRPQRRGTAWARNHLTTVARSVRVLLMWRRRDPLPASATEHALTLTEPLRETP